MDRQAHGGAQQHEGTGGDPDLSLERDDLAATGDREPGGGPGLGPPLDIDDLGEPGGLKFFAGLASATSRAADDVQGLLAAGVGGGPGGGVKLIEGHIASEVDVDFLELDRGADVDQLDGVASVAEGVQLFGRDGGDAHERLRGRRLALDSEHRCLAIFRTVWVLGSGKRRKWI